MDETMPFKVGNRRNIRQRKRESERDKLNYNESGDDSSPKKNLYKHCPDFFFIL